MDPEQAALTAFGLPSGMTRVVVLPSQGLPAAAARCLETGTTAERRSSMSVGTRFINRKLELVTPCW
jgi:hypothetical protein